MKEAKQNLGSEEAKDSVETAPIDLNSFAIFIKDNKVLVIREKGRKLFNLPGGGIESGEIPPKGLLREVEEELGVQIPQDKLKPAGTFWGPTGRKKRLKAECFFVDGTDYQFNPEKEIEEMAWVNSRSSSNYNLSWILKHEILPFLVKSQLIE